MNCKNDAVRDFVVNVLGCRCPEEVFRDIRLNRSPTPVGDVPLLFDIRVGGRLLVWGVAAGELSGRATSMAALAAAGARTRDDNGFNRFRLMAVTDEPAEMPELHRNFAELAGLDDRMHLHIVEKRQLRELLVD